MDMKITQAILDELTAKAKESPRLRMNLDLRDSAEDSSQRMLNAIEPGSPLPIHRHQNDIGFVSREARYEARCCTSAAE